jgi:hypothetical protein
MDPSYKHYRWTSVDLRGVARSRASYRLGRFAGAGAALSAIGFVHHWASSTSSGAHVISLAHLSLSLSLWLSLVCHTRAITIAPRHCTGFFLLEQSPDAEELQAVLTVLGGWSVQRISPRSAQCFRIGLSL